MPLYLHHAHPWDVTPAEARELQGELLAHLRIEPLDLRVVRTVAGVDASFSGDQIHAAAVLLSYPELNEIAQHLVTRQVSFPYIPGLLSFRESPGYLSALEGLPALPDALLVDGHGYAHPRRFGIACHLGVLLDLPTIGCAKSILVGKMAPLGEDVGSISDLVDKGEVVGKALRTRKGASPVFVSIGQRVDLKTCVEFVVGCTRDHRLPEPARLAHSLAGRS
jgi:deoxyribonuclease V